jgi:16S rRNA (adenine1518-N6/adenine1519-N6)-dimethyltransferase
LLDLLVRAAALTPQDVVLEIGAGTAGLTTRLSAVAGQIVAVECDPRFYQLARQQTADCANVRLLHADALAGKNQMNPEVLAAVKAAMQDLDVDHYDIAANLPYDIAASIIGNVILERPCPRSITATVQLEVAQRLLAQPGMKDYGPLSVLIQVSGQAQVIRTLAPSVFWPRPKVHSAIVRVDFPTDPRKRHPDLAEFHGFVRQLFLHRRKKLRGSLAALCHDNGATDNVEVALRAIGVSVDVRAEQIDADHLYQLFHTVRSRGSGT